MLDLLITGGTVVDGTGAPGVTAAVGVRDGRIVPAEVGDAASRTIDASGLVVAPGFVDLHTHYDAQLSWDGFATPSCFHGTTSVAGGNCGFTLAPLRPDYADYLMRMMSVVEGMPLVSLQTALSWDWTSYPEWLSRFEGQLAVNAGFMVGHSALRLAVMGEAAIAEPATDEQIIAMSALLDECLAAGGLGFSTSQSYSHTDHTGHPVPSRAATREELLALAAVTGRVDGTTNLEIATSGASRGFSPDEIALLTEMSSVAGRPINWNTLNIRPDDPDFVPRQLSVSDAAAEHGARVIPLVMPRVTPSRVSFGTGMPLNMIKGWEETFALDHGARKQALADPARRRHLAETAAVADLGVHRNLVDWARTKVLEGFTPQVRALEGRTGEEIANERGTSPFDAILDLAILDDLHTVFVAPPRDADDESWRRRAELWRDPRTVLGGSDAGAHLDVLCGAGYTTALLGEGVRDRGLIDLESAVHEITDVPARLMGFDGRGRLADGWCADIVIFDPDTVAQGTERAVDDLPGGAVRLVTRPTGVHHVFVNGTEIVHEGELTGSLPGQVLRRSS